MEKLLKQIDEKEQELLKLQEEYVNRVEEQKKEVLKYKSKGINKSLYLLGFEFESSSSRTPQYLEFHKVFKKELSAVLKLHVKRVEFSKPNHFDVSGFFELLNGKIYYFSLSDLRLDKGNILIRTATDFKDYSGGSNNFLKLDKDFIMSLFNYLRI